MGVAETRFARLTHRNKIKQAIWPFGITSVIRLYRIGATKMDANGPQDVVEWVNRAIGARLGPKLLFALCLKGA